MKRTWCLSTMTEMIISCQVNILYFINSEDYTLINTTNTLTNTQTPIHSHTHMYTTKRLNPTLDFRKTISV